MITMTRRVTFSSAHADWIASLSESENRAVFGVHASPEPYGHNYTLDVSVEGAISPQTGMVVNIKIIDAITRENAAAVFDRKYINRQVPYFAEHAVTIESLTGYIAAALAPKMPDSVTLTAIRLEQTPLVFAEWFANDAPRRKNKRMQITHTYEFSASHRLDSPYLSPDENTALFGKCNNPNGHGHNYLVEVTVGGSLDPRTGRVIDPDRLDAIVNENVVNRYDHKHLNEDIAEFADLIPSAENITKVIFERLRDHIPAPAKLERILLRETARNLFEYRGEEN